MTQIDYVLVGYRDQKHITDAKVVPYEANAAQHHPLICTMKITPPKQKYDEGCGPSRIKWWRLKEKEDAIISRISSPPVTTVEETWQHATQTIAVTRSGLGVTKANRRKIDQQTWLWTDEVKQTVREKKRLYHVYLRSKTAENWRKYLRSEENSEESCGHGEGSPLRRNQQGVGHERWRTACLWSRQVPETAGGGCGKISRNQR
ncbi:hypothetical protein Y032_0329g2668 [Ancylostoma ceylanicum]|uniref:Uncharacterized protein n=1 Tax=Ancylostoma ceylanicum TaxID=53326 RepID=A0A016S0A5_9BILA|nr:hypothetical protein Y032_0329g2668 [Ancylostoma ceylanicum]